MALSFIRRRCRFLGTTARIFQHSLSTLAESVPGCDFMHWLVVMDWPIGDSSREEVINRYVKTLATVVQSEELAREKIYSVSTRHYPAFGAAVGESTAIAMKELPGVRWVIPDAYVDVKDKLYGDEPFINGQVVPYDPKYHKNWNANVYVEDSEGSTPTSASSKE